MSSAEGAVAVGDVRGTAVDCKCMHAAGAMALYCEVVFGDGGGHCGENERGMMPGDKLERCLISAGNRQRVARAVGLSLSEF